MRRVWNKERDNYLIQIHQGKSNKEIAELFNQKFNTELTVSAINSRKRVLKLISNYKYCSKYNEKIIEYLKKNHKGKSTIELSNEINQKFGLNTDPDSIQNLKSRIKRRDGFIFEPARNDGCIKKGNIPINKGKKWDDYMSKDAQARSRKTTFKKGNKPLNAVDIGEESMRYSGSKPDDLGYVHVKVCDGKGNKNWIPKQRVIYEQHYGPIPKGHKVIFADGNRFNFDIDNLVLVSSSEELIMNQKSLRYDDQDLTKTGHLIAKVIDKRNKLRK